MGFSIRTPPQIHFGRSKKELVAPAAASFGGRGILVHGANPDRAAWLVKELRAKGLVFETLACDTEPTLPMLEARLAEARPFRPDWVIGLGGGAALDLGKALAALIPSSSPVMDHLEVVGLGLPLMAEPLPFIAVPTTSGTGAEVTMNAVIGLPDHRRKVSLRDPRMFARLAIVDPSLTDHCPWTVTFASGMDAIVQVAEPLVSLRANPYADALARPAISLGLTALQSLSKTEDAAARDTMAWVSLSGGLALASAGLGAVHGLAGPIGGVCLAPHGAICASLFGPVLSMNRQRAAIGSRQEQRLQELCARIAEGLGTKAELAPQALAKWLRDHGISGLCDQGLNRADHPEVARSALTSSSMASNPVSLTEADLLSILTDATS